jgi:hypothetical protein
MHTIGYSCPEQRDNNIENCLDRLWTSANNNNNNILITEIAYDVYTHTTYTKIWR